MAIIPKRPRGNERGDEPRESKRSILFAASIGIAIVVGGGLYYRSTIEDPDAPGTVTPSASSSADLAPVVERCMTLPETEELVIGEVPAVLSDPDAGMDEPSFQPFSVLVGRARVGEGRFEVGALAENEGGSFAVRLAIPFVAPFGKGTMGRIVRSRGDMEAPVVAPHGADTIVAVLEPNASGLALRLSKIDARGKVTWGAELEQKRDDSLAYDLLVEGERGIVAWDELDKETSRVAVAGFGSKDLQMRATRFMTSKKADADSPRLLPRTKGAYLVYLARGEAAKPESSEDAGSKGKKSDGEIDEELGGERVPSAWIEVQRLDEDGAGEGEPLRATSTDGHVATFDVIASGDDGLIMAYRDDDSPSGGVGGALSIVRVLSSGTVEREEVDSEVVAEGTPTLARGWLVMQSLRGSVFLARMSPDGKLAEPLVEEPSLARMEVLAAEGSNLLVVQNKGKAAVFRVFTCNPVTTRVMTSSSPSFDAPPAPVPSP